MDNLFDRSSQQEFTWQSKHIKFFLDLKGIGPSAVERIIEINPDVEQWDREYVANQSSNYEKTMKLLKDVEEIPNLQDLGRDNVIHFKDALFPNNLFLMKKNKPLLLWYAGNLNVEKSIAVVGSRKIIPETAEVVNRFVKEASLFNYSIVSGLANGVDEKAHITALENSLKTVAILPSSLDNILPNSNRELAREIVANEGLLLTEYEPNSPKRPDNSNYIARNRIQAGLSDAVFVGQSSIPGGTMTTAKFAIDYEKPLIVYKSLTNIGLEEYKGNKYLLKKIDDEFDFSILKFNNSQKLELLKKYSIADYSIGQNLRDIDNIFSLINKDNGK